MAFFDSKSSVFQINDGSLRDLSAFITEISNIPGPRNLSDVTSLADSGRKWLPGLEDGTITLRGLFDPTATTGPDAVLGVLRTDTTARAWDYGPQGKASGEVKYSGNCFVESYELGSRVGNAVEWNATLRVDGTITRGTYA